jgi:hypothetical protein
MTTAKEAGLETLAAALAAVEAAAREVGAKDIVVIVVVVVVVIVIVKVKVKVKVGNK